MIIKIIKNNTSTPQIWEGVSLDPGEAYNLLPVYWTAWTSNPIIEQAILANEILVNDGTSDLAPSNGVIHLNRWQPDSEGSATDQHAGWYNIVEDQIVEVAENKQMRINGTLTLSGILQVSGNVVVD